MGVPEGWDVLPLGEMAEFRNGLNFAKDDEGQEIKVVTIPDFWQRTILRDFSEVKTIRCKGKVPETSFLESGDLLFVRSNGNPELVGRCLFFPQVAEPISFSGFTIRGRMNQARILPEFAASVMVTDRTKNQFRRGRGGGNISNLSQDILAGVQVALPPLPEQRKIAEILSTWDRAIEVSEALLATARQQKRALMQALLTGKRRFPEFKGQDWVNGKLMDHFDFINGRAFKPDDWGDTGLPIIRIQNLTGSTDSINYFCGEVGEKHMVRKGDFLLSWSATLDTFIWGGADAVLNQHIFKVVPQGNTLKMFGFHLITYEIGKLVSKVHGTSMKHITKKDLAKIASYFPPVSEQERIAEILDAAQQEIDDIDTDIEKLRTEKRALMQQLLTGKRRVVV